MRELKFRIWNTEEYYYTDPEHLGEYHFGIGKGIDNASKDKIYDTSKWVWQQFTGLVDKNDKEIYEGDICQRKETIGDGYKNPKTVISRCEIVYNEDRFALEWITESFYNDSLRSHVNDLEVIGNIYETQELLS